MSDWIMVARIAPSPITTSVAIGDAMAHAANPNPASPSHPQNEQQFALAQQQSTQAHAPQPPAPPGEAFAAAVIAGQLPPRPITPEQLRQRLGSAWQPPASPLRLMDRSA